MTIATYSELVSELEAYLNRSDLSARIPTFIRLFETRMNRRLNDPSMAVTATTAISSGEDTYALPSDYLMGRSVYIDSDPKEVLVAMTPAALRDTYANAETGKPQAYAVIGSNIVLAPTPDGDYDLILDYFQSIPALTSTESTNWLLSEHPDAYLFGTLCQAQAFLQDDPRLAVWKDAWDEATAEIIQHAHRKSKPASPLTMRPTVFE